MYSSLSASVLGGLVLGTLVLASGPASATDDICRGLPSHAQLHAALSAVVAGGGNGGLGNDMWGTVVNRDGRVCAVVFTGDARDDQWPGSRVISAQKANTANAFSLEGNYPNVGLGRALATGNLYGLVLPGGSLFGLQFSNPVDTAVAYGGPSHQNGGAWRYGTRRDPMVGRFIGGVNVFGGGLALYDQSGRLVGGIGVSGDTACTDHIIAWKTRDMLGLDNIPGGVGDGGTNDNLIINDPPTVNSFEHPPCGFGEEDIIDDLAADFPIG